jgi:hypothetical protein
MKSQCVEELTEFIFFFFHFGIFFCESLSGKYFQKLNFVEKLCAAVPVLVEGICLQARDSASYIILDPVDSRRKIYRIMYTVRSIVNADPRRIIWLFWIRIRIGNADSDPDPESKEFDQS